MRVISRKVIEEFAAHYPAAVSPLGVWYRATRKAKWCNFQDVRATSANTADSVGRCVVFDIGGNKFRLIARILYCRETPEGRVYIRAILTHKQHDEGAWKKDCGAK